MKNDVITSINTDSKTGMIPKDAIFKSITISRDPSGKHYASILVSVEIPVKPLTGKMIGIDLGLKDLFILSDGQVVNNPRWFRENQSKLKRKQQHLSRKKISSFIKFYRNTRLW